MRSRAVAVRAERRRWWWRGFSRIQRYDSGALSTEGNLEQKGVEERTGTVETQSGVVSAYTLFSLLLCPRIASLSGARACVRTCALTRARSLSRTHSRALSLCLSVCARAHMCVCVCTCMLFIRQSTVYCPASPELRESSPASARCCNQVLCRLHICFSASATRKPYLLCDPAFERTHSGSQPHVHTAIVISDSDLLTYFPARYECDALIFSLEHFQGHGLDDSSTNALRHPQVASRICEMRTILEDLAPSLQVPTRSVQVSQAEELGGTGKMLFSFCAMQLV